MESSISPPVMTEERMAKAQKTVLKKEESAMVAQSKPNHAEKIKSQVLAKIGMPPRLHRVVGGGRRGGHFRGERGPGQRLLDGALDGT